MTPDLILAAIKSGFDFGTELLKYYQTPEGQKAIGELLANRDKAAQFITDLFSGKLLGAPPK